MRLNKAVLLSAVFGSGVAWPMAMYGYTIQNFLYGIGIGIAEFVLVGVVMAIGTLLSRARNKITSQRD